MLATLRSVLAAEGVRGLYRGVQSPLLGQMALNSVMFATYGLAVEVGHPAGSVGGHRGLPASSRRGGCSLATLFPSSPCRVASAYDGITQQAPHRVT